MSEKVICPACGAENNCPSRRCDQCGEPLTGLQPGKKPRQTIDSAYQTDAHDDTDDAREARQKCGECDAPVPAGVTECLYCGKQIVSTYELQWPWDETSEISEQDFYVGRVKPVDRALADRLEREFLNVSRCHARLLICGGKLVLIDLDSTNGTWINDQRVQPRIATIVPRGALIRFGADLKLMVR